MSALNRFRVGGCSNESAGIVQMPTRKHTMIAPAHIYHPTLHPIVSMKTPPSTSPKENPSGCPSPIQANPTFRFLPLATALVRIPTEVGKQRATAIPCMARNMINSIAVRASPHASMKQASRRQPMRKTGRLPTTSATAPAIRRHEPLVKLYVWRESSTPSHLLKKGNEIEQHIPVDRQGPFDDISDELDERK